MTTSLLIHPADGRATMAIALVSFMGLSPSSQGAITAHFDEQVGGVSVTFSGTISLDPTIITDANHATIPDSRVTTDTLYFGGNYLYSDQRNGSYTRGQGAPRPSGLTTTIISESYYDIFPSEVPLFGFENSTNPRFPGGILLFSPVHVSGGTLRSPSELTISPSTGSFLIPFATANSLNLGAVQEGTILWASGGNAASPDNVIIFSTSPIPEPSCALFLGVLLGPVFFFRKRRSCCANER
jgi:hypothetical protein